MARILKRPQKPTKPGSDPHTVVVLDRICSRAEQLIALREQERKLMAEQRKDMNLARASGATLRRIGAAAQMAPQTVLNQLDQESA